MIKHSIALVLLSEEERRLAVLVSPKAAEVVIYEHGDPGKAQRFDVQLNDHSGNNVLQESRSFPTYLRARERVSSVLRERVEQVIDNLHSDADQYRRTAKSWLEDARKHQEKADGLALEAEAKQATIVELSRLLDEAAQTRTK